jgi:hypothetical protein
VQGNARAWMAAFATGPDIAQNRGVAHDLLTRRA